MLVLKDNRSYEFEYCEDEKVVSTFKFKFNFSEEKNYSSVIESLRKSEPLEDGKFDERELALILTKARDKEIRESLISCKGVELEDEVGKKYPCVITDENGKVNIFNQKLIFEFIKSQPDILEKITQAQGGLSQKNL